MSSKFHAIFKQSVKSIDYAKNIIVIKCYTGMANAACAALDSMNRSGVVGDPGRGRHHFCSDE